MDVFVSVGTGLNAAQEAFVSAVEERLKAVGLNPCTIGRNTFSTEAPLHAVIELMDRCVGTVIVAVERYRVESGVERRASPQEKPLSGVAFPTAWNQIEAAMAYGRGLPLLVLVDEQLRCDGLLERGNDWFVHEVPLDPAALNDPSFTGLLKDWRDRIVRRQEKTAAAAPPEAAKRLDPASMTIGELLGALKPAQLWTSLVGVSAAILGAFYLGMKVASG